MNNNIHTWDLCRIGSWVEMKLAWVEMKLAWVEIKLAWVQKKLACIVPKNQSGGGSKIGFGSLAKDLTPTTEVFGQRPKYKTLILGLWPKT